MAKLKTGQVQVYTGEGKGKTTAAVGLAVRAAGAGLRVFFGQFCKGRSVSEHEGLRRFEDAITIRQSGACTFITEGPSPEDIAAAHEMLGELRAALETGDYEVVIADELNVALELGLVSLPEVLALLTVRPADVELVITGRHAPPELMARADLVTEMLAIKHPYAQGLQGRKGIEY
jgi:cob(I)alamin adenosyltransferase